MTTKIDKGVRPEMMTKVLQVHTMAVEPTDAQHAAIRPFLLRDFAPDELYIRQMELANDAVDRSHERFDIGYLNRFAETIKGKSVLIGHESGSAPVGRFFEASVGPGANGWNWVKPMFYMPKSLGNQLARDNIDSGVWSYVSIGAYVDYDGLVCDICGRSYYGYLQQSDEPGVVQTEYCPHIKGKPYDGVVCDTTFDSTRSDMSKVEGVEGSIVYLGCQYDAAIAKSAASDCAMTQQKAAYVAAITVSDTQSENEETDTMKIVKLSKDYEALSIGDLVRVNEEFAQQIIDAGAGEEVAKTPELDTAVWYPDSAHTAVTAELNSTKAELAEYRASLIGEIERVAKLAGEDASYAILIGKMETREELTALLIEASGKWDKKCPPGSMSRLSAEGVEQPVASAHRLNWRDHSSI